MAVALALPATGASADPTPGGGLADQYTLEILGPPAGGVSSSALGINDNGDVVGITRPTGSAQPQQTVLWERHGDHFHAHVLDNLEGSAFSRGFDLNNDQNIVGEAFDSAGTSVPIRWAGESAPVRVTNLNATGTGLLNDISDDGVAVGTASGMAVKVNPDGTVVILPPPGPAGSTATSMTATAVANGGVIGGRASITPPGGSAGALSGVVWDANGTRLLPAPLGASAPVVADVRPDGVAAGSATVGSTEVAVQWDAAGTPVLLATPNVGGYNHAAAKAISADLVVGYASQYAGNTSYGGAAVAWDSAGAHDLSARVADLPAGVVLQAALDVNRSGQIVGSAYTPEGARGFVLTPVGSATTYQVSIEHFPNEFTDGQQYTLQAQPSPAVPGATYRWEMQVTGSSAWLPINDAAGPVTTAQITFTARQAWDGFAWRVALIDADGDRLAESAAHEMRVSLGVPTVNGLHILGLAGHYHSGGTIQLTAVLVPADPSPAQYRWSMKRAGQAAYHAVTGQTDETFAITAEQALEGAMVKVERLVGGVPVATSEPVTLEVDDHGAPPAQAVSIAGASTYRAGSAVELTASVSPATVLDRYQWFIREAGAAAPQPVPGANAATYSFTAEPRHNGAELTVAVIEENGTVIYGPSEPYSLAVAASPQPGGVFPGTGGAAGPSATGSDPAGGAPLPPTGATAPSLALAAICLMLAGTAAVARGRRRPTLS
ncbi:MAG: hypothetical protein LBH68_03180 [Bifidobacteriaceae bacterium]|nr:hypothetical protein [Bifidobacteriaceae bacterium]